jgi:hypothetical protein
VILSILATVAVLAAIATVAAALFLAETTLVYIALGLGGISVLLLLAALVQGGISTGRQERTRTGTDGLGKSSVPAVATTAATPPGTYGEPGDSGRVPAPAHHGPVRDTVVSGQEVPGVTPAPGDWPQPATGSLGPDPAGPYGDVPAEEALPAPRPEASEPGSPAFTYRIPHQGRAEDHTRTSAPDEAAAPEPEETGPFSVWARSEGTVAEPVGDEPDTGERADRTPATGEDDSAGSARAHGADRTPTDAGEPLDEWHAATHDTGTPIPDVPADTDTGPSAGAYASDEVDEPDSGPTAAAERADDEAGTAEAWDTVDEEAPRVLDREEASAEDDDPDETATSGDKEPRADRSEGPDGTAEDDAVGDTAPEPWDQFDDARGVDHPAQADTDEPDESAGSADAEPAGPDESARSTERAESAASAESDEPVEPTGSAADAEPYGSDEPAQPVAPAESAEEGTGTADADEPTGSDTGGATAFSYRVPSADASRADESDADETAAFTYRVPGTAAGGATGPDADEDADAAYAAILDGEDEPSAPDRTSRPQDPDQVS